MGPFWKLLKLLFTTLTITSVIPILGCGYHFRATGEPIGIKLESLAIPLIRSTSTELGFEGDFTRVIRQEFASHAKIPLVSREKASAVLLGEIYEIETDPLSFSLVQTTVQGKVANYEVTNSRRIRIKLAAKMVERATGKVIWHEKDMEEKASYLVGADPLENRFNQRRAVEEMAQRLARRIFLRTLERF
jgi:outer membrane lipopolysaccharide assembly protein LptE/RlpB